MKKNVTRRINQNFVPENLLISGEKNRTNKFSGENGENSWFVLKNTSTGKPFKSCVK